jgi:hypothetical protein
MKWQAVIVLLAIALTITIPPSLSFTCGNAEHTMIVNLDICHSKVPALSPGRSMPFIQERLSHPLPPLLQETSEVINHLCKPVITAFQDERPPKA